MLARHMVFSLFVCSLSWGAVATAQEAGPRIHLTTGEVLPGTVDAVAKNRARLKLADGNTRQIDVRTIDHERAADGTRRWFAAELTDGPVTPEARAVLARLQKGQQVPPMELLPLAANFPAALADEFEKLLAHKSAPARAAAAQTLALTATKETMRKALDAAIADTSGAMWREVAPSLTNGTALGALQALDACADVEKAITHKDKAVRAAAAWVAVTLGSTAARPVLATFLADSDHHMRESAAMCLAEAGDAAGAKILITICKREQSPAMTANRDADASTKAFLARAAEAERVRACELLGTLHHEAALPTLRSLSKNENPRIAAAAQRAVSQIGA